MAEAAGKPEWCSVLDINVPLHQHSLSQSIDKASYNQFLPGLWNPFHGSRWVVGWCNRIYRHDSIQDAVYSAAQSAALVPRKEVPSSDPWYPQPSRQHLHSQLKLAALDVTVISTLQQLTLHGAASTQEHALVVGEEGSWAAHAEACCALGVLFISLVVESLWGYALSAMALALAPIEFNLQLH